MKRYAKNLIRNFNLFLKKKKPKLTKLAHFHEFFNVQLLNSIFLFSIKILIILNDYHSIFIYYYYYLSIGNYFYTYCLLFYPFTYFLLKCI